MKTLTMRVDDDTYQIIKNAASGERRNISNFVENATMQYLSSFGSVSDDEMNEIIADEDLVKQLKLGLQQLKDGEYNIV